VLEVMLVSRRFVRELQGRARRRQAGGPGGKVLEVTKAPAHAGTRPTSAGGDCLDGGRQRLRETARQRLGILQRLCVRQDADADVILVRHGGHVE
jgi:hypothetical protein